MFLDWLRQTYRQLGAKSCATLPSTMPIVKRYWAETDIRLSGVQLNPPNQQVL